MTPESASSSPLRLPKRQCVPATSAGTTLKVGLFHQAKHDVIPGLSPGSTRVAACRKMDWVPAFAGMKPSFDFAARNGGGC